MSIRQKPTDLPPMSTPYSVLLEQRKDTLTTPLATKMAEIITEHVAQEPRSEQTLPPAATAKEIVLATTKAIRTEATIPEDIPIKERIGKIGLMWPRTHALNHPATPLLQEFSTKGCPADCGPNWTQAQIEAAIQHGPHKSARSKEARAALRAEAMTKVKQGFARIIKYKDIVRNNIPPQLKVSPAACIPHKSRKFRVILDLSFRLRYRDTYINSVNDTTTPQAPPEAMGQLGSCFRRLVATMAHNCDHEHPFYFSKLDIKDGFWRMVVANDQAWNFTYVLPSADGRDVDLPETELVVPDALQMGWCESPPFFCSASETARDVIQVLIDRQEALPFHKFEGKLMPTNLTETRPSRPISQLEVFVDDFIAATNKATRENFLHMSRCMLHGVHSIFPPSEVTLHGGGDSIAEKKLDKQEGRWATTKEILGWVVNGMDYTIQLPQDKVDKILNRLKKLKTFKKKIPRKLIYAIAGSLEHASFGIPGGAGLFSPIQQALKGSAQWIKVTTNLSTCFQDWGAIIKHMAKTPTHVQQLVKGLPDYVGFSDSCKIGTGGVWSSGCISIVPILWSLEWPEDIKQLFIDGILSINDLELAGMVLNWLALECLAPLLKFKHAALFGDNSSAVQWAFKLRASASEVAGRLLRLLGMRIHARKASHISALGIIGDNNLMADIISRAFKHGKYFHAHNKLTDYFNVHFPLPQNVSWMEFTFPTKLAQRVMSCLRGEQLTMGSLLRLPQIAKNTGKSGFAMLPPGSSIHTCSNVTKSTSSLSSELLLQGSGQASSVEDFKSKFRPLLKPSRPSQRPSVWLENPVPLKRQKMSTSSQLNASSKE